MNITNFHRQYIKIIENKKLNTNERNKQLDLLMIKMENECSIPIIYQEEYARKNKHVLELYQTISRSRKTREWEMLFWWRKKKKTG